MISQEVVLAQTLFRNRELSLEIKEINNLLSILGHAIDKLGKHPEFSEAHKFLMQEIPTVECP